MRSSCAAAWAGFSSSPCADWLKQRDAGEVRAEVVVDVLGDARAFALDGLLAMDDFQFAAHPAARDEQHNPR